MTATSPAAIVKSDSSRRFACNAAKRGIEYADENEHHGHLHLHPTCPICKTRRFNLRGILGWFGSYIILYYIICKHTLVFDYLKIT